MTTSDFSCELESSCRVKLAITRSETCGWSCEGVELLNPFWGECEFVNHVRGEVVVDVRGLVDDLVLWSARSEDFR